MLEERQKAIMQKSTAQVIYTFPLRQERQRHIHTALITSQEVLIHSIVMNACIFECLICLNENYLYIFGKGRAMVVITICNDGNGGVRG